MWREPINTNRYLWVAFTLATFVFAGAVVEFSIKGGDATFWKLCGQHADCSTCARQL